jgi:hypothetical protein
MTPEPTPTLKGPEARIEVLNAAFTWAGDQARKATGDTRIEFERLADHLHGRWDKARLDLADKSNSIS